MRLILVRHGESTGNFENRMQGSEGDLTDLGLRQALLAGMRLHELGATTLYSSPLPRALQTAHNIAERLGSRPIELAGVGEYDFGELAGLTYAEVRARFANDPVLAALPPAERVYPGEEGRERFQQRVVESFWGVIDNHPDQTVAVVSHGGPIALFCQSVLRLPYRRPMPFVIANGSFTTIEVSESGGERSAYLYCLNDTCHLDALRQE